MRDKVTKRRRGKEVVEWGRRPLAREGGLYLDICVGDPEFQVTPLQMGPVCLLSQGWFEEPVCSCAFGVQCVSDERR